jgi:Zn finger protein HypA/HybF involved in hydrogenase expression
MVVMTRCWCRKCKDFTMIVTAMQEECVRMWCPVCKTKDRYIPDNSLIVDVP